MKIFLKIIPISLIMPTIIILGCLMRMPSAHLSLPTTTLHHSSSSPHSSINSPSILMQQYSLSLSFLFITYLIFPPRSTMAISGFEGFEKRLELQFSGNDSFGLRRLTLAAIDQILRAVQCTIVSAASNFAFDAYVLSESSLFIYPDRVIIKTCGTTQLLRSVPLFLRHANTIGLLPTACRYTRGEFIFPAAQPYPHTGFPEEILYLEKNLPDSLTYHKACVLPSNLSNHSWHVYSASDTPIAIGTPKAELLTVEVCMTELDRAVAGKFYRVSDDRNSDHAAAKEMTESADIAGILPYALVCDHAFDPCGYSMNGLAGDCYSTIHVTPEDGFSYASFEYCTTAGEGEVSDVLRRVANVFRPGTMSVSVTGGGGGEWLLAVKALEKVGLNCRSHAAEEFPGAGIVTYQTFTARRK